MYNTNEFFLNVHKTLNNLLDKKSYKALLQSNDFDNTITVTKIGAIMDEFYSIMLNTKNINAINKQADNISKVIYEFNNLHNSINEIFK